MNRNLSLVLVAAAAVCGLALAQVPQRSDAAQLAALQKRVEALEAEVTVLKAVKPAAASSAEHDAALAKERQILAGVVKYLQAQSGAAERLQAELADSEAKGFTYGINPDSRIVLLQGFNDFAESLRADVLAAPAPATPEQPAIKR